MVGACLQACVSLATGNSYYAILPATTFLSIRILDALMIYLNIRSNPYMEKVFLKKSTTIIPSAEGQMTAPGSEKVAVLLLGAKSNHPFGILDPEFLTFTGWLGKMNDSFELEKERPRGCKFCFESSHSRMKKLIRSQQSLVRQIGIAKMSVGPWSSISYPIGEILMICLHSRMALFIERLGHGGRKQSNSTT